MLTVLGQLHASQSMTACLATNRLVDPLGGRDGRVSSLLGLVTYGSVVEGDLQPNANQYTG